MADRRGDHQCVEHLVVAEDVRYRVWSAAGEDHRTDGVEAHHPRRPARGLRTPSRWRTPANTARPSPMPSRAPGRAPPAAPSDATWCDTPRNRGRSTRLEAGAGNTGFDMLMCRPCVRSWRACPREGARSGLLVAADGHPPLLLRSWQHPLGLVVADRAARDAPSAANSSMVKIRWACAPDTSSAVAVSVAIPLFATRTSPFRQPLLQPGTPDQAPGRTSTMLTWRGAERCCGEALGLSLRDKLSLPREPKLLGGVVVHDGSPCWNGPTSLVASSTMPVGAANPLSSCWQQYAAG